MFSNIVSLEYAKEREEREKKNIKYIKIYRNMFIKSSKYHFTNLSAFYN